LTGFRGNKQGGRIRLALIAKKTLYQGRGHEVSEGSQKERPVQEGGHYSTSFLTRNLPPSHPENQKQKKTGLMKGSWGRLRFAGRDDHEVGGGISKKFP